MLQKKLTQVLLLLNEMRGFWGYNRAWRHCIIMYIMLKGICMLIER